MKQYMDSQEWRSVVRLGIIPSYICWFSQYKQQFSSWNALLYEEHWQNCWRSRRTLTYPMASVHRRVRGNYLGFNHFVVCSSLLIYHWWTHQSWIHQKRKWRTGILGVEMILPELDLILFNPRSVILSKSFWILIQNFNLTVGLLKMTFLFSNWTYHSPSTVMYNLHVCHPQSHTLDWVLQQNNASQVDGDFCSQVCPNHCNTIFIPRFMFYVFSPFFKYKGAHHQTYVNMYKYQLSQMKFVTMLMVVR